MNKNDFTIMSQQFLTQAFAELNSLDFHLKSNWHIDHLCYRTSSEENYQKIKNDFLTFSKLLIESEVNGRVIATVKLENPIYFNDWKIDLVEIPAPKKGKETLEGLEHFEVVIDETFKELKDRYSHIKYSEKGLEKDFNQELEFNFNHFAIKFHQLSLESVINIEKNIKIFEALKKTEILKKLKAYSPLVAGTFPLDLQTDHSDIDVLIYANDFPEIVKVLKTNFENYDQFQLKETSNYILVSFCYDGVFFEVFGQNEFPVKQVAYRHFLVEERLLKLAGSEFKEAIVRKRHSGLKTEPAFGEVLNLKIENSDIYQKLLELQQNSNKELENFLIK